MPLCPPNNRLLTARVRSLRHARLAVFKQGVHCYSLRSATHEQPQWLSGVGRAWLNQWRASQDCFISAAQQLSASTVLGGSLLSAASHQLQRAIDDESGGGGSAAAAPLINAESALLAVLSSTPHGFEERIDGLRLCLHAGPSCWWALPLLLQPPLTTARWDSLTLASCADLLEPALRAQGRADGMPDNNAIAICAAAAAAQPALQAVLALRSGQPETLRTAIRRCTDAERRTLLQIAIGFTGYTLAQRLQALAAVSSVWWQSARSSNADEPRGERD